MSYSAGEFVRDAAEAMREIWARGRQPLLVGGTMLYFHALTAGLAELPEADARIREQIDGQAAASGWASLHEELARVDPQAAARIHVNDPQRIQRALEVYRPQAPPSLDCNKTVGVYSRASRCWRSRWHPAIAATCTGESPRASRP